MSTRSVNSRPWAAFVGAAGVAIAIGVLTALVLGLLPSGSIEVPRISTGGDDGTIGDPYPPPAIETVTPSPEPDVQGILPPPEGVATDTTTIGGSPWSALLVQLDSALLAEDASQLASYVYEDQYDATPLSADGGTNQLRQSDAEAMFEQLFQNQSLPRMQGYFAAFSGDECIDLVTTGWIGPAEIPTPASIPPTPTLSRPQMDGPGHLAERVNGDTFVWRVCDWGNGQPLIMSWFDGHYHPLLERYFESMQTGPDPAWYKYTMILP